MKPFYVLMVPIFCCAMSAYAGTVGLSSGQPQGPSFVKKQTAHLDRAQKKLDVDFAGISMDKTQVPAETLQMQQQRDRVLLMLKDRQKQLSAGAQDGKVQAGDGEHQTGANAGNGRAQATDGEHKTAALAANGRAQATDGEHKVLGGAADGKAQASDGEHKANAAAQDGRALATDGQNRANGQLFKQGATGPVVGGASNAGGHSGVMRNSQRAANLTADRKYKLDTRQTDRDSFRADGAHPDTGVQHEFGLDSESVSRTASSGHLLMKNGTDNQWKYDLATDGKQQGQVDLVDTSAKPSLFARQVSSWHCTAEKDGMSLCRDQEGNVAGKVVANERGDANVYNKDGVVIGRGEARQLDDEHYVVKINQGLFEAQTKRLVQYDCYDEIVAGGQQTKRIEIHEPVKFEYNTIKNADGTESYSWPDCFKMTVDVTIPPGVDAKRVAMEYVVHVLPLGNLRCMDPGTCGRDCYYCNLCEKTQAKRLDVMLNAESDACEAQAGGRRTLSTTVCPPQEQMDWHLCSGFDRHLFGNYYFKYNGSINAQVRAWMRPLNEETLRKNFFDRVAIPFQKQALQAEYALDMAKFGIIGTPEDNELLEWYVRKNGQEELLACRKAIVDYGLGGEKVNTNLLIDAFSQVGSDQKFKLFSQEPCAEWRQAQQAEYAAYQEAYEASKKGSTSGLVGRLGGIFQRRT
jgi:hypothetical protein